MNFGILILCFSFFNIFLRISKLFAYQTLGFVFYRKHLKWILRFTSLSFTFPFLSAILSITFSKGNDPYFTIFIAIFWFQIFVKLILTLEKDFETFYSWFILIFFKSRIPLLEAYFIGKCKCSCNHFTKLQIIALLKWKPLKLFYRLLRNFYL